MHAEASPIWESEHGRHGLAARVERVDLVQVLFRVFFADLHVAQSDGVDKAQQRALCLVSDLFRQFSRGFRRQNARGVAGIGGETLGDDLDQWGRHIRVLWHRFIVHACKWQKTMTKKILHIKNHRQIYKNEDSQKHSAIKTNKSPIITLKKNEKKNWKNEEMAQ